MARSTSLKPEALRKIRSDLELSRAQLADKLGVSRETIRLVEVGKLSPSLDLGSRWAALGGVHVEDGTAPEIDRESMVQSLAKTLGLSKQVPDHLVLGMAYTLVDGLRRDGVLK